jgi:hypothetical protein
MALPEEVLHVVQVHETGKKKKEEKRGTISFLESCEQFVFRFAVNKMKLNESGVDRRKGLLEC